MKTQKTLPLMIASIFTLILFASFVSATLDFVDSEGTELTSLTATVDQGEQATLTFYLEESGHDDMTDIALTTPMTLTFGTNTFDADLTGNLQTTLAQSATTSEVTVTFDISETQAVGTYTGDLEVTGKYATAVDYTIPVSITITQPPLPEEIIECRATAGTAGDANDDLVVKIDDIKVEGFGDDNEWMPLDEIEVEIEVENKNDDEKISNLEIAWGLYNEDTDEWYIDEEENDFDLKKDDEKKMTITFRLDDNVDELEDGTYVLYVWANGEIDTEETDNVPICGSDSEEIEIIDENDFVVLDFNYQLTGTHQFKFPDSVPCGQSVQMTADVWNVGTDDQEEVYIMVHNTVLGINEKVTIGDIDSFEDEPLTFNFEAPSDVEEGEYYLTFTVFDDNDDIYENDYDDEDSEYHVLVDVSGNCKIKPEATVAAEIESGGQAGKELVVKATITNDADESRTYSVTAGNYGSWATLDDISPSVVVLEAGEAQEVVYTFMVDREASGTQTFNIEVKTGESEVEIMRQAVSVTVAERAPGFTGNVISGDNWHLWGIGILNAILIIIIIIVAVRIARK